MTDGLPHIQRYPALDGLRAYAAMLIFALHLIGGLLTEYFHVPEPLISAQSPLPILAVFSFLADGHHGVEVFFVISGFLMARIARPEIPWWRFMLRRLARIYPALLASIAVSAWVYCSWYGWSFVPRDFALNLVLANAFPGIQLITYNHVTWTLGYELAFYLAVPVMVRLRNPRARMSIALGAACALLVFVPLPAARMASLFTGFALGCLADSFFLRHRRWFPMTLVILAYGSTVIAKAMGWLPVGAFFAILPWLLPVVIARILVDDGPVGRVFGSFPMRTLGKWSYSLYLWHPLTLAIVLYTLLPASGLIGHAPAAAAFVIATSMAITVMVAVLSYRIFEAPYFAHHRRAALSRPAVEPGTGFSAGP